MKFMAFFFLILLIYIGINGWLFHALLQTTRQWHVAGKIVISMVYWLLAISFFLMQVWRDKLPVETGHWLYWISNGWLAFFFYLALLYGIAMLLKLVGLRIPHAFVWCTGATALLLICGYIHFDRPMVRRIKLDLPHSAPMRIVAVSDVHLGYGITRGRLQRYVDLINSQHPDLILIAGDLIDMSVAPLWKERMQDELNRLQAPMGIYMVPGNHEYISGIRQSTAFIEQTRITLLRDSVVRLPNGIQLAGRDDRSNRRRQSVNQLLTQADRSQPLFVVDHQPVNEEVEQLVDAHVDFALFGHTHHGQLFPMSWVTDAIYRQSHGYRTYNNTHICVSSGLGLWGPPFRIGTDSELVVIEVL